MLTAAAADPLAATRSLVAALLDVPRGTPPLLTPRVRRLASVSTTSLGSPYPGRSTSDGRRAPPDPRPPEAPGARGGHRPRDDQLAGGGGHRWKAAGISRRRGRLAAPSVRRALRTGRVGHRG